MNISRQIGRGLTALTFCMAIGAYAAVGQTEDGRSAKDEPQVAHSRIEIVTLPETSGPRWAVAGVRVGDPVRIEPREHHRAAIVSVGG